MDSTLDCKPHICFKFEVEKIIGISSDGNYQVQWSPAWVSKFHLVGCEHLIQEFLQEKQPQGNSAVEPTDLLHDPTSASNDIETKPDPGYLVGEHLVIGEISVNEESLERLEEIVDIKSEPNDQEEEPDPSIVITARKEGFLEQDVIAIKSEDEVQLGISEVALGIQKENFVLDFDVGSIESSDLISLQSKDLMEMTVANGAVDESLTEEESYFPTSSPVVSEIDTLKLSKNNGPQDHVSLGENELTDGTNTRTSDNPVHNKHYKCHQCSKKFSDKDKFDRHNCKKEGSRKKGPKHKKVQNICNHCGYSCLNKNTMKTHIRSHTGEKPFTCNLCSFASARKHHLADHMRAHRGEKPYSCNVCEKAFTRVGDMKRHERGHSGEKPFVCDQCHMSFTQASSLSRHRRMNYCSGGGLQLDS